MRLSPFFLNFSKHEVLPLLQNMGERREGMPLADASRESALKIKLTSWGHSNRSVQAFLSPPIMNRFEKLFQEIYSKVILSYFQFITKICSGAW